MTCFEYSYYTVQQGSLFYSVTDIYTTKGALCAQKLGNGIFYQHFSTPSYSDIAPIDNFDLTFFFYFVFEVFDTIQF